MLAFLTNMASSVFGQETEGHCQLASYHEPSSRTLPPFPTYVTIHPKPSLRSGLSSVMQAPQVAFGDSYPTR